MGKSIDPMLAGERQGQRRQSLPQHSSASISFQLAIPWRVGLHQILPPLHQPESQRAVNLSRQSRVFQRTANSVLTGCLKLEPNFVHFGVAAGRRYVIRDVGWSVLGESWRPQNAVPKFFWGTRLETRASPERQLLPGFRERGFGTVTRNGAQ
jgi:hypothetical protein